MTLFQLSGATLRAIAALVWSLAARDAWRFLLTRRPQGRLFRMLPILLSIVALGQFIYALFWLVPPDLLQHPPPLLVLVFVLSDYSTLVTMPLARHLLHLVPTYGRPTSALWLTVNYGSLGLVATLTLFFDVLIPLPTFEQRLLAYRVVYFVYQLVMGVAFIREIAPFARRGAWGPGGGVFALRRADIVLAAAGGFVICGLLALALSLGERGAPRWLYLDLAIGYVFAAPVAVRMLGDVVRGLSIAAATLATTGGIYSAVHLWLLPSTPADLVGLTHLATVVAIVLVLVLGHSWLRAGVDSLVFRRSRDRRADLQRFLHTLSPELGVRECGRRALEALTRVMKLRGAALWFRDGELIRQGGGRLEPLQCVWSREAVAELLPTGMMTGYGLAELPPTLFAAVIETDVIGIVAVQSPRRRWGHLVATGGHLAAVHTDEDAQTVEGFADQLSLVLDGAELLDRAVAVERSLAHAEKLAAIGETAARIAHEIRNPVTAARSLAQQLSREPGSPFGEEHGLILTELERVERQVAALLRFARREEFAFTEVDLSDLARSTFEDLRPGLEAIGIEVTSQVADGIVGRADREKLRQVLLNLIENARDALSEVKRGKRIGLAMTATNGTAHLQVSDTGPGVPRESLSRLFEPFFSLKEKGTGLGLAIVKRTVEAHGGRIVASCPAGVGMTFQIDLPLARGVQP